VLEEFVLENRDTRLAGLGGRIGATLIFVEQRDKEEPEPDNDE
jgi:hypothetical protein